MSVQKQQKNMAQFCVGCGLCLGICPTNAISLTRVDGAKTITIDPSECTNCGKCIKNCVALSNLYTKSSTDLYDKGTINEVFFGHSNDENILRNAASGGVITSLLLFMLKKKIVDQVLIVKTDGLDVSSFLTRDADDVLSAQGSIYFKTFSLRVFPKIIQQLKKGNKICIVGLPCQIHSLKNVLNEFRENVYFISPICSHVNEQWYMDYVFENCLPKGAKPLSVSARQKGRSGGIRVRFSLNNQQNVQESSISYGAQFWGLLPSLGISAPLGCLTCPNHFAPDADIVTGDAWNSKFDGKQTESFSIMFGRTTKGYELLNSAINDGVLNVGRAKVQDLLVSQAFNVIEVQHYSRVRKKLLHHNLSALWEMKAIDNAIIGTLVTINRFARKYKTLQRLFTNSIVKKILGIILWILEQCEFNRFVKLIDASQKELD